MSPESGAPKVHPGRADLAARWNCQRPGCDHHNIMLVGVNYPMAGEKIWLQCKERECGEMAEFVVMADFQNLISTFNEKE